VTLENWPFLQSILLLTRAADGEIIQLPKLKSQPHTPTFSEARSAAARCGQVGPEATSASIFPSCFFIRQLRGGFVAARSLCTFTWSNL